MSRNAHGFHGKGRHNGPVPQPEQPMTRRDARRDPATPDAARPRGGRRLPPGAARWAVIAVAVLLVLGVTAVVATALSSGEQAAPEGAMPSPTVSASADAVALPAGASAAAADSIPAPAQTSVAGASCDAPAVTAALASGSDADVIAAFGGADAFRAAVAGGAAPCVSLSDARHLWVVVDKKRPLDPLDFEPASVAAPASMQRTVDGRLVPDAANALTALVAAAAKEGAGAIGLNSAYRSFASQTRTYNGYVDSMGRDQADQQSARPGYSEHQTGLATDVAACDNGCGTIESFGGTPQGAWTAANAWRFGFIVRYEPGQTAITGYEAEAWHLRYIGPDLAKAYHDGGYHTLEEFFGLPAAPGY